MIEAVEIVNHIEPVKAAFPFIPVLIWGSTIGAGAWWWFGGEEETPTGNQFLQGFGIMFLVLIILTFFFLIRLNKSLTQ